MFSKPLSHRLGLPPRVTWCYSTADKPKPFEWPRVQVLSRRTLMWQAQKLQRDGVVDADSCPLAGPTGCQRLGQPHLEERAAGYWVAIRIEHISQLPSGPGHPFHPLQLGVGSQCPDRDETEDGSETGTGEDFQVFLLSRRPLFKQPGQRRPLRPPGGESGRRGVAAEA